MRNKEKVASILMALTVGGVAGHHIDDIIEKYNLQTERYPMSIEYKIIEKCISNYNEPLSERGYRNKRKVCICALEKTELVYEYSLFRDDNKGFLNEFGDKVRECI